MKKVCYFLLICSLLSIYSCNSGNKGMSEGSIEYKITYINFEKNNILINVLPEVMITSFKNNSTSAKIEGFFGIFQMANIYSSDNQSNITLLKMMDKKYSYEADAKKPSHNYKGMKDLKIKYSDETKTIAGFLCHKALAYFPDTARSPIELYYTKEIQIKNPNIGNPFCEIDGVLLEFQLELSNIQMRLVATKLNQISISNDDFKIPQGYKPVSKEMMESEIAKLASEGQNP